METIEYHFECLLIVLHFDMVHLKMVINHPIIVYQVCKNYESSLLLNVQVNKDRQIRHALGIFDFLVENTITI